MNCLKRKPSTRHQTVFHASGIAKPSYLPAARAQKLGNCQSREDMPASAASHD
jgi:hypothetical protein